MRETEAIYQEMLADFSAGAGWSPEPGCDLAVRLYAAAAQIQALEAQADWVLDQSFPQTAQGLYLDRHARLRGLTRQAAVPATGVLRFTVTSAPAADLTVPAGTVCMTAGEVRFRTLAPAILAAGTVQADAPAEAVEPGSGGNAAAGTVCILTACPVGITGCTNPEAFSGGRDAEEDADLRERVLETYRRLPNGANAAWYERSAMAHGGVAAARAVGRARGIGTVDVYIATEAGLPGEALLEEVRRDLREKRELAVDVQVLAPRTTAVNLDIAVTPAAGAAFSAVRDRVEQALRSFFSGRLLGCPVRLAELGQLIYTREGVENYSIRSPGADLAAETGVLPVLGTLRLTELEG